MKLRRKIRNNKSDDLSHQKRSLEQLLDEINGSLEYLSRHFHLGGYDSKDLLQIMRLHIIETYRKNRVYYSRRTLGFWFMRCRWSLLNLHRVNSRRNPLANSISIDNVVDNFRKD